MALVPTDLLLEVEITRRRAEAIAAANLPTPERPMHLTRVEVLGELLELAHQHRSQAEGYSEWASLDAALPKTVTRVWCALSDGRVVLGYRTINQNRWRLDRTNEDLDGVTHWSPLIIPKHPGTP